MLDVVNVLQGPTNPVSEMPDEPFEKARKATVELETTPRSTSQGS